MSQGFIEVAGGRLYYEVKGVATASPVVLLHAGTLDSSAWDDQVELLASLRTVVRYDARAHGRSTTPTGQFAHYEDLRELLTALSISRATLVGVSVGARTAIDFAIAYPDMVEAMLLASPGISGMQFEDPVTLSRMQGLSEAAAALDADGVVEWLLRLWVDGPRRDPAAVGTRVRDRCRSLIMHWVTTHAPVATQATELGAIDQLSRIAGPVTVMVGDLDSSDIQRMSQLLIANVAGSRLIGFPSAGHQLNMEQPERFNRAPIDLVG